jgi:hypothetical protein
MHNCSGLGIRSIIEGDDSSTARNYPMSANSPATSVAQIVRSASRKLKQRAQQIPPGARLAAAPRLRHDRGN